MKCCGWIPSVGACTAYESCMHMLTSIGMKRPTCLSCLSRHTSGAVCLVLATRLDANGMTSLMRPYRICNELADHALAAHRSPCSSLTSVRMTVTSSETKPVWFSPRHEVHECIRGGSRKPFTPRQPHAYVHMFEYYQQEDLRSQLIRTAMCLNPARTPSLHVHTMPCTIHTGRHRATAPWNHRLIDKDGNCRLPVQIPAAHCLAVQCLTGKCTVAALRLFHPVDACGVLGLVRRCCSRQGPAWQVRGFARTSIFTAALAGRVACTHAAARSLTTGLSSVPCACARACHEGSKRLDRSAATHFLPAPASSMEGVVVPLFGPLRSRLCPSQMFSHASICCCEWHLRTRACMPLHMHTTKPHAHAHVHVRA